MLCTQHRDEAGQHNASQAASPSAYNGALPAFEFSALCKQAFHYMLIRWHIASGTTLCKRMLPNF